MAPGLARPQPTSRGLLGTLCKEGWLKGRTALVTVFPWYRLVSGFALYRFAMCWQLLLGSANVSVQVQDIQSTLWRPCLKVAAFKNKFSTRSTLWQLRLVSGDSTLWQFCLKVKTAQYKCGRRSTLWQLRLESHNCSVQVWYTKYTLATPGQLAGFGKTANELAFRWASGWFCLRKKELIGLQF